MGKEDVRRMMNKLVVSAVIDRIGVKRLIGDRLLPIGVGSRVSQDGSSCIIMQRLFISSVSANSGISAGCIETQCNTESGKTTVFSRVATQSRRGFDQSHEAYKSMGSSQHAGCTVGSDFTAIGRRCTLGVNKSSWVTALHRNDFSSLNTGQEGIKSKEEKVSIEARSSEDAHNVSHQQPKDGPPPDPPGLFATMGAMTAGAGGAVLVAALGVWAVFKMAFWVAKETGHSLLSSAGTSNETEARQEQAHPDR